jgi:hypothetical protein
MSIQEYFQRIEEEKKRENEFQDFYDSLGKRLFFGATVIAYIGILYFGWSRVVAWHTPDWWLSLLALIIVGFLVAMAAGVFVFIAQMLAVQSVIDDFRRKYTRR